MRLYLYCFVGHDRKFNNTKITDSPFCVCSTERTAFMQYKKRKNRLKLISLVMSVVMLVPYMSGYSVATTEDNTAAVQSTSSETADVSQISPSLPTVLDLSTVPDIIGAEKAQSAGHVQRAYASEENLNTVSFNNADGTRTDYIFNHPVKYVDTDGKIKDITLGLQANSNKAGGYVSKDTRSQTSFSAKFTDGIMLSGGDVSIRLVPVLSRSGVVTPVIPIAPVERSSVREGNISVNISPIAELSADGKSVVYTCDSKTRYEYSLTYSGFKEDIIVSEYTGQTEYTFKLYTGGLTLTEDDGDFYLCDAYGNVKGTLGSVIVFTADWQNNTFGSMSAQTVTANQEYEITIHLDAEYLRDEATLYPITIDPTIELNYTSDPDGIQDIVINTVDILSGTDGEISAGKWGSDQSISRILMKFPGLDLSDILSTGSVVSATVYIHDLMCQHEELTLECYPFTGNVWSESNATWANAGQPSSYSSGSMLDSHVISYFVGLEQPVSQEYGFDITGAVRGWIDGTYDQNKGIIFKAAAENENDTVHNYKTFSSYQRANYKPYVKVVYDSYVPGIAFVECDYHSIPVSGTIDLGWYVVKSPGDAVVTYKSSNSSVISVNSSTGVATANYVGSAVITASIVVNGVKYSDTVEVYSEFQDGVYKVKNYYQNYFLDVTDRNIVGNVEVIQYPFEGGLNQYWKVSYIGKGQYTFSPMHNPDMLLAATSSSVYAVDSTTLTDYNWSDSKYAWEIEYSPYARKYCIKNAAIDNFYNHLAAGSGYLLYLDEYADEDLVFWDFTSVTFEPRILMYDTYTDTLLHDSAVDGADLNLQDVLVYDDGQRISLESRKWKFVYVDANSITTRVLWSTDDTSVNVTNGGDVSFKKFGLATVVGRRGNVEVHYNIKSVLCGEYYIKNKWYGKYLATHDYDITSNANIALNPFSSNQTPMWKVRYVASRDYYLISVFNDYTYYLGTEMDLEDSGANIVLRNGNITDGMRFRITLSPSDDYTIMPLTGESTEDYDYQRVMTVDTLLNLDNNAVKQLYPTGNTKDEWILERPLYEATVDHYYDKGYYVYYNEQEYESREKIAMYANAVASRYYDLFGLFVKMQYPTYYQSPIDICKQTVTQSNIDALCNH